MPVLRGRTPPSVTFTDSPIRPGVGLELRDRPGRRSGCAGTSRPSQSLTVFGPLPRSGVGSIEVDGITFQRFMETCGIDQIDLMKLDIEGSEVELLESLPNDVLDRIDQMTVAFHDF